MLVYTHCVDSWQCIANLMLVSCAMFAWSSGIFSCYYTSIFQFCPFPLIVCLSLPSIQGKTQILYIKHFSSTVAPPRGVGRNSPQVKAFYLHLPPPNPLLFRGTQCTRTMSSRIQLLAPIFACLHLPRF